MEISLPTAYLKQTRRCQLENHPQDLPTAQSLHRMTVYHTPNCHRCGVLETTEHLLLQCPAVKPFWGQIQQYVNQLTDHRVALTDTTVLLGYLPKKDDPLSLRTIHLLNWTPDRVISVTSF